MRKINRIFGMACLTIALAFGHELQENRATLVLRDKTHVSMTLYLSYSTVLHQSLAPQRPLAEFLAIYSSMRTEDLARELAKAQAKFQAGTKIYLPPGGEAALSNWLWPDAKQVQGLLQRCIMQALTDPSGHFHEEPVEIHADARSTGEIVAVKVMFPAEFQKVLVVSYKPSQTWVEPKTPSSVIRF